MQMQRKNTVPLDSKSQSEPIFWDVTCIQSNSIFKSQQQNLKIWQITNVKLTTAQFPNPDWRPRECSTRAHRLLLSRCPSIVNCYALCPQSRQRLASTDFCEEKSWNLNIRVFKSIKISPCFPISSVWLYVTFDYSWFVPLCWSQLDKDRCGSTADQLIRFLPFIGSIHL